MATRRKSARKSKKKSKPARRGKSVSVKAPRAVAPPAELRALDSEWRSFIDKSAPDAPLTKIWKAPKGTPSSKAAIHKSIGKAPVKKAAKKKAPSRKKAGARKAPARKAAKKK